MDGEPMPFIDWHPDFEMKVDEFDQHHKHLFSLLNAVYEGFVEKNASTKVSEILDELLDYASYHFSAEEYWMKEHHFPGLAAHRQEHEFFSGRVVEMQHDLVKGNSPALREVLTFLRNWITNHILATDAEYGRYIEVKYS
jgi:hemerythrin